MTDTAQAIVSLTEELTTVRNTFDQQNTLNGETRAQMISTANTAVSGAVASIGSGVFTLTVDPSLSADTDTEFSTIHKAIAATPASAYVVLLLKGDVETVGTISLKQRYVAIKPHPDLNISDGQYVTLTGTTGAIGAFGSGVKGFAGGTLRFSNIHIKTGVHESGVSVIGYSFFRATELPTDVLFRSCKITLQHVTLLSVFIGRFSAIGTESGGSGTIIEHDPAVASGEHGKLAAFNFSGAAASFANYILPAGLPSITHVCTGVLLDDDGAAKNLVTNIGNWTP